MPWYFPWSDSIKKRACRYLLQHYMGHFLKEKLSLDQLSVDLYNGTGQIHDVLLDVAALNEALDAHNVPVEIVDGFIGTIEITIPWNALVNENTLVEIRNLEITIQPRQRAESAGVMLDSMFSSMTTSLQLAQECLKQETTEGEQHASSAQPFEGLDQFAQTIEAVLARIKLCFLDTIVRLEHLPREASTGVAVELKIKRIEYFDDQANESKATPADKGPSGGRNILEPVAIAIKNFHFMGVSVYCDEFSACHRTVNKETSLFESAVGSMSKVASLSLSPEVSPKPPLPGFPSLPKESEPIKIAVLMGKQEVKVKIKQNDELPGPKLEIDSQIGSVTLHVSPRQVHLLLEIAKGLSTPGTCDDSNVRPKGGLSKPMVSEDFEKVEHELQKQLQYGRLQTSGMIPATIWSVDEELTTHPLDDCDDDLYYDLASSTTSGHASMDSSISSASTASTAHSSATRSSVTSAGGGMYAQGSYVQHRRESPFQSTIPRSAIHRQRPSPASTRHKESLHKLLDDPAAELTRYKMKMSFVSVLILHDDPPTTPSDGIDPAHSSVEKLKEMSEKYFGRVQGINTAGMGAELVKMREQFSEACPFDHIGILCKPLTIECNQKSSAAVYSMSADISVGLMEIVEAVFDRSKATASLMGFHLPIENVLPEYYELLTFEPDLPDTRHHMFSSMQASSTAALKVKIHTVEKHHQSSRRMFCPPKTEVHLELGRCRVELDITIVDRISSLLNPQPLVHTTAMHGSAYKSYTASSNQPHQTIFSQTIDEGATASESKLDLRLTSPFCTCSLRFPIPDLRSGQGISKPWWRRCLRQERLIVELTDADVQTSFCDADPMSKVEFTCREAHGLFQNSSEQSPMSFIRISKGDSPILDSDEGFDWPRLVLKMFPASHSVLEEVLEESPEESMTPLDSLNGACQFTKPESSPFSSKKVMYDNEELVMPGDRQEMTEFQEKSMSNTKMSLEFSLPNVNAILPNKDFFELLYNRLINDLVLWQPLAPTPLDTQDAHALMSGQVLRLDMATQMLHEDEPNPRFSLCQSGLQYDSSSDSEDGTGMYSVQDQRQRQKRKQMQERRKLQSKMCVSVGIGHGRLAACVAIKDEDDKVRLKKQGEFLFEIEEGNLLVVANHNGNPDLQFLCVQAHTAAVFHNGCVDIPSELSVIERAEYSAPVDLDPTLYQSERGVHTKLSGQVGLQGGDSQDMLSLALRIDMDTLENIKKYQIAVGIRGATLRHQMTLPQHSWIEQILYLFDVVDYPISGYTLPKIVTELHLHLWSCAVDYRPIYLPLRVMITAETFSMSSNIVAGSPTSLLRFLIDDGAIYLSDRCQASDVDLKKNYVCVMDLGLFELSLRCSDGRDPKYAKLDLRASNNITHIRTCSDSLHAMGELINYIADDGDLMGSPEKRESMERVMNESGQSSSTVSSSPQMTQSNMEQVHDMMEDAMRESSSGNSSTEHSPEKDPKKATEVFFFPDEGQTDNSSTKNKKGKKNKSSKKATTDVVDGASSSKDIVASTDSKGSTSDSVSVSEDKQSVTSSTSAMSDTEKYSDDEEFCIINDPGMGIAPRDGEPKTRVLTKEPIQVHDNHFHMPLGKTDQLKTPEHYPPAIYRYTLKEMSLVWHMYGGKDFESSPPSKTDQLSFISHRRPHSKRSSNSDQQKRLGHVGWRARGGVGRNIDLLMELQLSKVRMQYELFPETSEQASRQILLVNELEIRDRMTASKINKFLYQYSSDSMPRQSHANMLVLKAVHVRPDPALPSQECSLRVALQPLRLNIDQDALFFLKAFFIEIAQSDSRTSSPGLARRPSESSLQGGATPAARPNTPPPVMSLGSQGASSPSSPNPLDLIKFDEIEDAMREGEPGEVEVEEEPAVKVQPVFIKNFIFSPDVPIRLDYHGKRVDTQQGTVAGLLAGLAQLNCSELKLKRLHHRHGLLGFDRLVQYALGEWLQDIRRNQIPSILGGVGPMHSLVQLVQGIRDLFWLPVEQYKKDGRIVRGIQKGANSFMRCTAMSSLELTNRVVQTVQGAAEIAYDMVSPGPSVRQKKRRRFKKITQPADLREGVTNAYNIVREGIAGTAQTIMNVAVCEHEQKGMTGAVGGVLRQVPPTLIQPVILTTEATSNILGGMRNQLLPDKKREDEEKWKPEDS